MLACLTVLGCVLVRRQQRRVEAATLVENRHTPGSPSRSASGTLSDVDMESELTSARVGHEGDYGIIQPSPDYMMGDVATMTDADLMSTRETRAGGRGTVASSNRN